KHFIGTEGSVHFICRNLMKSVLCKSSLFFPGVFSGFKQCECTKHIRRDERFCILYRSIDMRICCEMNYAGNRIVVKNVMDELLICNISMYKLIVWQVFHFIQITS